MWCVRLLRLCNESWPALRSLCFAGCEPVVFLRRWARRIRTAKYTQQILPIWRSDEQLDEQDVGEHRAIQTKVTCWPPAICAWVCAHAHVCGHACKEAGARA
eukprot:9831761-Alexandrium_andersonii.AAC.1